MDVEYDGLLRAAHHLTQINDVAHICRGRVQAGGGGGHLKPVSWSEKEPFLSDSPHTELLSRREFLHRLKTSFKSSSIIIFLFLKEEKASVLCTLLLMELLPSARPRFTWNTARTWLLRLESEAKIRLRGKWPIRGRCWARVWSISCSIGSEGSSTTPVSQVLQPPLPGYLLLAETLPPPCHKHQ